MRSLSETSRYNEYHNRSLYSCLAKNRNSRSTRRVSFYPRNQVRYIERDLKYCDKEYLEAADLILNGSKRTSKRSGNLVMLVLKRLICDWTNESDHIIDESRLDSSLLEAFKDAFRDRFERLPLYVESSESEAEYMTRKIYHVVQRNGWPEAYEYSKVDPLVSDLNKLSKKCHSKRMWIKHTGGIPEDFHVDFSQNREHQYDSRIESIATSDYTDPQLKDIKSIKFMSIEEITAEISTVAKIKNASRCAHVKENCDRRLNFLKIKLEEHGYYS